MNGHVKGPIIGQFLAFVFQISNQAMHVGSHKKKLESAKSVYS